MLRAQVYLTLAAALVAAYPAYANDKSLSWHLKKSGSFDVLFHRAQSTATGAVLGGLIGAGIEEGVRSGKDRKKRDALTPHLADESCEKEFKSSFTRKLEHNEFIVKYFDTAKELQREEANLAAMLSIKKCGFKLVDGTSPKLAAFIEFESLVTTLRRTQIRKCTCISVRKAILSKS